MGELRGTADALRGWFRAHRQDVALGLLLAVIAFVGSWALQAYLRLETIDMPNDVWFDGDSPSYRTAWLYRDANHTRSDKHPLLSLLTFPAVFVIEHVVGDGQLALALVVAASAALWAALLWAMLRVMACQRVDAFMLVLLGCVSAAAVFWFSAPESYPLSSCTIVVGLAFAALLDRRGGELPLSYHVGASLITLSVTVTNWMVGLLATLTTRSPAKFLRANGTAVAITALLWLVQKAVFPTARIPLAVQAGEARFLFNPISGGPIYILKSMWLDTMVFPELKIRAVEHTHWGFMSVQMSAPGSGSLAGLLALLVWVCALMLGLLSLFQLRELPRLRFVLGLSLLGQIAIHFVYGIETFLFSLHFLPFLLCLVALSTLGKWGALARGLVIATLVLSAINNVDGLQTAQRLVHDGTLSGAAEQANGDAG